MSEEKETYEIIIHLDKFKVDEMVRKICDIQLAYQILYEHFSVTELTKVRDKLTNLLDYFPDNMIENASNYKEVFEGLLKNLMYAEKIGAKT